MTALAAERDRDRGPRARARGGEPAGTYLKLERKVGDFATVAVAVHVSFADDGTVERAGIALTARGRDERPRAAAPRRRCRGARSTTRRSARRRGSRPRPPSRFDDIRGTAEYKRNMVRVFTERGLRQARDQEGGSQ